PLRDHERESTHAHTNRGAADERRADRGHARAGLRDTMATAPAELITVAPRGQFRTQRLTNAHQRHAVAQLRETDVVGREAQFRAAESALAVLDCFPSLLER